MKKRALRTTLISQSRITQLKRDGEDGGSGNALERFEPRSVENVLAGRAHM